MPDRPAAPPRFASRNAVATDPAASWTWHLGSYARSSAGIGERGCGGRSSGSVSARHVASVPGASSAAVRVHRAAGRCRQAGRVRRSGGVEDAAQKP